MKDQKTLEAFAMTWSGKRLVEPHVAYDVIIIQRRLRLGATKEIDYNLGPTRIQLQEITITSFDPTEQLICEFNL
jgi:hypothetical protein